jgi:PKD repeat protein
MSDGQTRPFSKAAGSHDRSHRPGDRGRNRRLSLVLILLASLVTFGLAPATAQTPPFVEIVTPDDGEVLDGTTTLRANVVGGTASSVEFFYRAHDDGAPTSLGLATFDATSGLWTLPWDTTTVVDTHTDIGGTDVQLTKPPTHDELSVVATVGGSPLTDAIDVRIQNMLTVRYTLPDNQEDLRGFEDLEVLTSSEFEVTSVRFDLYDVTSADPRIFIPFGEASEQGEPIENPHYGRPLGAPVFPSGSPEFEIGTAVPEGARRWVYRGWDTTTIPDGTYALVATAEDAGGRRATYTVETYIVNDLNIVITAPADGAEVSRFVALEARTSSMTGADNAAPGSLFPATAVDFTIGATTIAATETPAGSGRWRAVWDGDSFAPGAYTITATATNENPAGAETAIDTVDVTLVAPGAELEAFFPFDWTNCTLQVCSFLDGSGGGPTSWEWDFDGDGVVDSTDQLPTHTYADTGVYEVTLTVSDGVDTSSYSRVIPVGNIGTVGFNINPINDEMTEVIDWTSAFKEFDYTVGETLAIPVMWRASTGATEFVSAPTSVCPTPESGPTPCVLFTPEGADGNPPRVVDPEDVGPVQDGVLLEMEFTEVAVRGITDAFKGKVNMRIRVNVDSGTDGNPDLDWQAQLGTNVDVTNTGVDGDENRIVEIVSPFEGQFVGGLVPVTAATVSTVGADSVEFFVNDTTSLGTGVLGPNGWTVTWDTTTGSFPDGPYTLTAVADFDGTLTPSAARAVNVENAIPEEPDPPAGTFQTGRVTDTIGPYLTFGHEIEEEEEEEPGGGGGGGGGGPPAGGLLMPDAAMSASFSNIEVIAGGGVIGGDLLEMDVTITNDSPAGSGIVLSAFAFQSKVSESPALASRVGDKLFYGQVVPGSLVTTAGSALGTVKKNGTSNGLFGGEWKGICINSSLDFIPEFNSGLEDESLECAGNRADANNDGEPELQTGSAMLGLRPGESQTIRIRLDSGTTDGALHVVDPDSLQGTVIGTPVVGPNGLTYLVPTIDTSLPLCVPPATEGCRNVVGIPDFGDNKVLRDADGTFNPTFAPAADGLTFENQTYLTLPRPNYAFTDILGRNHTCATYGVTGGLCSGGGSPEIPFLGDDSLVPGVENFAAILRGYGEFHDPDGDFVPDENPDFPDTGETRPNFPYDVLCENCGGLPYVPIAEFFVDNGDGSLTQSLVAGEYGDPVTAAYVATVDAETAEEVKEDVIPEPEPGGPCDPADPESLRPSCAQLRTSATGHFYDLQVVEGAGINGGDAVEFTIDITNTSRNPDAYLTAFNYQTKRRGLADIGILDGYTQDRRDIRVDSTLPPCTSPSQEACWNGLLGVGHFPNVVGNGLLFGQMVWPTDNVDRDGQVINDDLVHVSPSGIEPVDFWLESVKKNGPFSPILKGNTNFICIKSGLFEPDPDADAACAGQPAILVNPDGLPVPGNISQRLGLPPGETQPVRIRMEWGDFRGAMLEVVAGTINAGNIGDAHIGTGGLARDFDCSDQRELEWCHPDNVGELNGYLPNSDAEWLTPATLEEIEYVIINQPGDAPGLMDFQENFGEIMAMAGFLPSAEFYAPDPNPELVGTPDEGVLIRQQVLGTYATQPPIDGADPLSTISSPGNGTATLGGNVTFAGGSSDDSGVESVALTLRNAVTGQYLRPDGTWGAGVQSFPATVGPDGAWTWSGLVPPGWFQLTSQATDIAGKVQPTPAAHNFVLIDQAAPTSAITSPTHNQQVPAGNVTVTGTSSDDTVVHTVFLIVQDRSSFLPRFLQPNGRWSLLPYFFTTNLDRSTGNWTWSQQLPRGSYRATSFAVDYSLKFQWPVATRDFRVR